MVGALEVLHDGCANVAFSEAHHVRNERPAEVSRDLHGLPDRDLLEVRELARDVVIPKNVPIILVFQPVLDQRIQRLHVDVVGSQRSDRPRLLHLAHQGFIKVLGLVP